MAKDALYNLVYVSVASRPLEERDLVELLESARAKNATLGITGLLLFRDGAFMQALEGAKSEVKGLFETIAKDDRHDCVVVLYEGPIDSRSFPDWAMGFKSRCYTAVQRCPSFAQHQHRAFPSD